MCRREFGRMLRENNLLYSAKEVREFISYQETYYMKYAFAWWDLARRKGTWAPKDENIGGGAGWRAEEEATEAGRCCINWLTY